MDGLLKEERKRAGDVNKKAIVDAARKGSMPVAYCGFSCNHCFLGEWCGGCRSVFCCCSFGTLFEKGKCPNITCCLEKGLEGCFFCNELEGCTKGFYAENNDGAAACKAQALFIKKHGAEKFLKVQDKLHEKYDFRKIQEILGNHPDEALCLLEETWEVLQKTN